MARVRYISMLSEAPEVLADFYGRHFKMVVLGTSVEGDISLTDGYLKLSLLKMRPDLGEPKNEKGLHHIGIEVESIEAVKAKCRRRLPRMVVVSERGDLHHGEFRIYDPEYNPVSLSAKSFGMTKETRSCYRIQHIAFQAIDPDLLCDFYRDVFGFRELRLRNPEAGGRRISDGFLNISIQPFYSKEAGHVPRCGFNHCGIVMDAALAKRDQLGGKPVGEQIRVRDPDGNRLDLSTQQEWLVSTQ